MMRNTRQKRRLECVQTNLKPYHHVAQRKFASNTSPISSPTQNILSEEKKQRTESAEDFLDFLCFRNQPFLPRHLEHFADLRNNVMVIDNSESKDNESESEFFMNDDDSATSGFAPFTHIESYSNKTNINYTGKIKEITKCHVTCKEMKHIFDFVFKKNQSDSSLLFWAPPDWLVQTYPLDKLRFDVIMKHIHRLNNPLCENFITLKCIHKQLNRESKRITHIPYLGCNEIDLARLYEIVTAYGGIESVNDTQSWRCIADQIGLAKEYPGRVIRLEEHYLRYVIPYANLTEADRVKLHDEVLQDLKKCKDLDASNFTKRKSMTWKLFFRLAKNLTNTQNVENLNTNEIEDEFWKCVEKADRHVVGASAEILVTDEVVQFYAMKGKSWNFKNIFTHECSAFKYLTSCEEIVQPTIIFNSLFAISEWHRALHHCYVMSYIHNGAAKIWYVVSSCQSERMQKFLQNHPRKLVKPDELLQNGFNVERFIQREGDYVVLKPNSYYLTISSGYSFSEKVNLAPIVWFCSPYLRNFVFSLNEHVIAKLLVNTSRALCKKKCDAEIVRILIDKLNELKAFLDGVIRKLKKKSITNIIPANETSITECSICYKSCLMISVHQLKSKDGILCIDDAMKRVKKVTNSKTLVKNFIVECFVIPSELENLILKLSKKLDE